MYRFQTTPWLTASSADCTYQIYIVRYISELLNMRDVSTLSSKECVLTHFQVNTKCQLIFFFLFSFFFFHFDQKDMYFQHSFCFQKITFLFGVNLLSSQAEIYHMTAAMSYQCLLDIVDKIVLCKMLRISPRHIRNVTSFGWRGVIFFFKNCFN